ncbi:protein root UVB sensitive 3 [Sesamum angolense]|uniref:Protein root UVB sensitive 3 n=1 Tax=Sesamum angolense TaxID=2727404 RepID=A0AAE1X1A3_9LAMI|nr:protein root UVB sensitive 3 [Sesamum angolense]
MERHRFVMLTKTATITVTGDSVRKSGRSFSHLLRRILDAFVPEVENLFSLVGDLLVFCKVVQGAEGFPSSVTRDYVPFQVWDSLQGLSTYMRTMLSTQALLSAIGVGDKSATVIGATFHWFLRDLTGMLGGVLFTFYQEKNVTRWLKLSFFDMLSGMLMDLVSLCSIGIFVYCVLGSISRAFTGVASGATRAALTQHFALQNNAADISAKEGSQETVATMLGMALGMVLARITMGHSIAIWFCFLSLTIFHMYANYKAVRCLSLCTLNCERSSILLSHYMETGEVLSPKQVSVMEHVLPLWIASWRENMVEYLHQRVRLGVRVSSLNSDEVVDLSSLARSHYNKASVLGLENRTSSIAVSGMEGTLVYKFFR